MKKIPEYHRLNKTKTAEMSREELKRKLDEQAKKSAKKGHHNKPGSFEQRRQEKISEETKKLLPPKSPAKRRQEEERLRREKELKKRRRKKRGSNIIYYTILVIILTVTLIILCTTVFFKLEHINVLGDSDYSPEEIIEASGIEPGTNLIRLDLGGVREKIMDKFVRLDDVKVAKSFPSGVTITVTPSQAMANFLYGGKYYTISHTGRVMEISRTPDNDCTRIVGYVPEESVTVGGFIKAADKKQDELVRQLSDAVENSGIDGINKFNIADDLGIILVYRDRIQIKIGAPLDIDEKLTMARELIENYVGETEQVLLDISDTSRVVQKPLTEDAPPVTAAPVTETSLTEETPEQSAQ